MIDSSYEKYRDEANEALEDGETDVNGEPGHVMTHAEYDKSRDDYLAERYAERELWGDL